jgi:hypothetical protein
MVSQICFGQDMSEPCTVLLVCIVVEWAHGCCTRFRIQNVRDCSAVAYGRFCSAAVGAVLVMRSLLFCEQAQHSCLTAEATCFFDVAATACLQCWVEQGGWP